MREMEREGDSGSNVLVCERGKNGRTADEFLREAEERRVKC